MVGLCRINPCEHTTDLTREESITPKPPPPLQIVEESILLGISPPNTAKAEETPAGTGTTQLS